jgi:membrane protein DedA with SNARE-associated domain
MLTEYIAPITAFFISFIKSLGYLGIFIGMAIESPCEILLIPAGALIAQGEMNFFIVLLMGISGSLLGALFNYYLALLLGRRAVDKLVLKYGKFFFLDQNKIDKTDDFFKKHGEIATFVGRLVPGVRHLISLPAGFSRMNLFKFSLFTCLGAGLWTTVLMAIGYFFWDKSTWITQHLNLVFLTLALFGLFVLTLYILFKRKKKKLI